jgi:hypothetical protein
MRQRQLRVKQRPHREHAVAVEVIVRRDLHVVLSALAHEAERDLH